ncbi:PQQ-like beta-propeller repeat protein [candidate division WOR-3 bacterium]|uniref:PQQ-like beta-propeller repeat protein n=1 Tax=candidate division WOR-3 bacterium TaxID=2052148 RepID=A0A937XI38_UNCW3|nr:PQQ-like beta-propeller repeat protein [candidate division WOR-3 bacterium]
MDWKRTAATALLAVVVVLCLTGCPIRPPKTPGAPWGADSTWTGAAYTCSVVTTVSKGSIRYVMDWQDAVDTGDVAYLSEETAAVSHEWSAAGTYEVKAQAILDANPSKASEFSPALTVKVNPNNAPVVDSVLIPPVAVKDAETYITVYGSDPDGDDIRAIVKWSASSDTATELMPSPGGFAVSHVFTRVETADVIVRFQDWKGTKSAPETVYIAVGNEGGVKWWWRDPEGGTMSTSALVANDGDHEVVMGFSWGNSMFYSLRASNKALRSSTTTRWADQDFVSDPALSGGHVIVSSDEGEVYALALKGLSRAWRWPDIADEPLEPYIQFGAAAVNGSDLYLGRETDADSIDRLYKFTDAGGSVTPGPTYSLGGTTVVDAPVIDADGSVYFGTDSGYLVKIDADLSSPLWRLSLEPIGEVYGPVVGGDGTVYCGTDSSRLYAVNPDGSIRWTVTLDGVAARPAIGQSALFVGTEQGTVYSLDPNTGTTNWQQTLVQAFGFFTTPIVAANGYVYFQDDNDVLYCRKQTDGAKVWTCDCNYYLPDGGRKAGRARPGKGTLGLLDGLPNPSITSTGNIIVVGASALFCVAGYADGPLDPSAAWPKWQKDLSNTGKR